MNKGWVGPHIEQSQQWCAAFDGKPQVAFGGDMPAVAIRRLLEGTEAHPDSYALMCDANLSGTGAHTIYRSNIWNPPELLLPCGDCRGKGEYVGLLERETCQTCGGRKVVPV
jgi:DnaJ-class molecular chaperone